MNILVIANQLPYPPIRGNLIRLYHLYSRLARQHRLTWVCPIWQGNEQYVPAVERFCERVVELPQDESPIFPQRGWRRGLLRIVARLHWERLFVFCFGYVDAPGLYWLKKSAARVHLVEQVASSAPFDLVISDYEGNAELDPAGMDVPKVLMMHNVQSVLFRRARLGYRTTWEDRLFFWPELFKIRRYEKDNYARYHLAVAVSEPDRRAVRKQCPGLSVASIPNGVDTGYFQPSNDAIEPESLVYVGNYAYPPNADAIRYFCNDIFPLIRARATNARFVAVGPEPPEELSRCEGVETTGFVSDVRPHLARAGLVVIPLRVGGGTRLKILDALAMGKAIVSTTLGAEGIEVTHGENILLADDPRAFAEYVVRLIEQPEWRAHLGRNARRLAEQKYDWNILAAQLDDLLRQVVQEYGAARAKERYAQS